MQANVPIKLNIGGTKFMTTASTLTSRGENFFSVLLQGKTPIVRDEEGCIFIDRDGSYFAPLLSFLRTGELEIPPSMSRRALEREALFYLIDLNGAGTVMNPLSTTSLSLGASRHHDLRHDGIYLHRHQNGHFVGYYIFSIQAEVRYRSINNINANDLVYNRPCRYTKLQHPYVVLHWGTHSHPSKMIATVQPHGLTVEWRYPPRPEHRKPLALPFWPSVDPLLGVLYSDEYQRSGYTNHIRIYFADGQRANVTVLEKNSKVVLKKTADYKTETRDGLTTVYIENAFVELTLLSLGGLLMEVSCSTKRENKKIDFSCKSLRVFVAVGTENDASSEPEQDEIDIYEFLRTYHPTAHEDDSSEVAMSEESHQELWDEPYMMGRQLATPANSNNDL